MFVNLGGRRRTAARLAGLLVAGLQTFLNLPERGVELHANLGDDGDDADADEGGDQAVLDGRGAGFALRETNEGLHDITLPL